jgi:hypothetical protein
MSTSASAQIATVVVKDNPGSEIRGHTNGLRVDLHLGEDIIEVGGPSDQSRIRNGISPDAGDEAVDGEKRGESLHRDTVRAFRRTEQDGRPGDEGKVLSR